MINGFEAVNYPALLDFIDTNRRHLIDPKVTNSGHSDAFQELINATLELRERQTRVTMTLQNANATPNRVASILEGDGNDPSPASLLAAEAMIETYRSNS